MTRRLIVSLAAGAAALFVSAAAANAESVTLTLAHQYPATQPIGDGYNLWAKRVEELSNGDITVRVFPGSTLIGSDESFTAVSSGSVSASNMIGGFQAGDIPELASITMPFLFDDYGHYKRAVDGGLRELAAGWYEAKNIKLLSFFPKGNDQVFHKTKFLMTPEDFVGTQIRGVGGVSDDVLRALGANVVRLPTTEVTQGLQRGVVDGIVTNCVAHIGRSWHEQSPYASIVSLKNDIEGLGLNLDVWKGLSEAQQKILVDAAAEMEAFEWDLMERVESKDCFADWAERKVNVQVTTPEQKEALKAKVASVYDDYKAKLPIIEDVRKIVEAAR